MYKKFTLAHLYFLLLTILIVAAVFYRFEYFHQVGKDIYAYETAVTQILTGINPYKWTIESFNIEDPSNHGYAYFPTLLYINAALYLFAIVTSVPFQYLWKVPVIAADVGVGILVFYLIYTYKKDPKLMVLGLISTALWFFNPYLYLRQEYTYFDTLPILFMLLSLLYLKKDSVISGSLFALSVSFKTFPLILFPIFLIKSPKKLKFVAAGALVGLLISLPFLFSFKEFSTYLQGAVFVHGDRYVQGRPFLFFISYYMRIELFQIIPFKVYTYLAMLSPMVVSTFFLLKTKCSNEYTLSTVSFVLFYLFTPVLNRTYLLWAMPLVFISSTRIFKGRFFPSLWVNLAYFGFYFVYLYFWKDGFHIWRP